MAFCSIIEPEYEVVGEVKDEQALVAVADKLRLNATRSICLVVE
jgi:hypothetical protein